MGFDNLFLRDMIRVEARKQGVMIKEIRSSIKELTGCSKQLLSYWEHGYSKPRLEVVFKLAEFFGIVADKFIEEEV